MLYRPLYRGEIVWNRTRKRNAWGQHHQTSRPERDWIRLAAPELRIVSEERWTGAHRRLEDARAKYLRGTDGRLFGRPPGVDSKYLLPGFARCGCCNGVMHVRTRSHGRRRAAFYGCTSYWKRGRMVCHNRLEIAMDATDRRVLDTIASQVLQPDVVEAIVARALKAAAAKRPKASGEDLRDELSRVEREIANLTAVASAGGGNVPEIVAALKSRTACRAELTRQLQRLERPTAAETSRGLETEIRRRLDSWRELMGRHPVQARQILRKILTGPIVFTPATIDGEIGYRFNGEASVGRLLAGLDTVPLMVSSPTGFEPVFWP